MSLVDCGMLPAGGGAQVYWETSGNRDGVPLLWLHGGLGSGLGSGRYRHEALHQGKLAVAGFFAATVLPRLAAEREIAEPATLEPVELAEEAF